jgi:hypothetical protein
MEKLKGFGSGGEPKLNFMKIRMVHNTDVFSYIGGSSNG